MTVPAGGEVQYARRAVGRGAVVNVAFQLGLAFVTLVRGLTVAGFVSEADYGRWGLLGVALVVALGLRDLGARSKYVQQDEADQELEFQRAFTVELAFAAIAATAFGLLMAIVVVATGETALIAPALALAAVLPAFALQFPLWTYYRRMEFRRLRTLQATEPLVALVVTVGMAAAGAGYWSFVAGAVSGAWAGALVALVGAPYRPAVRWDPATARRYVAFTVPLAIAGLSTVATFQVVYLAGHGTVGVVGLGALTLAGNIVAFTARADAIISDALYPGLRAVRDRIGILFEAFVKSNRLALLWAVPFGVGLSLFASDLVVFVLGRRWTEAIALLQVMGLVAALQQIGFNWHVFYNVRGRTWPVAFTAVVSSLVLIGAALPLMSAHGLDGLALALVASEVVAFGLRMLFVQRLFPTFGAMRHVARALLPTVSVSGAVIAVRALDGGERSAAIAALEFAGYTLVIALLTLALERALLREALGYAGRPTIADA